MAAREVVWTITNQTGQTLTYEGNSLSSGVLANQPTQSINSGGQGAFAVESDGFMTGAVGSVSYGIHGGTFVFQFSDPYAGSDTVSVTCPNGYTAQTSQSTGNDNSVTSILSKA
jgi:hypothetical protein